MKIVKSFFETSKWKYLPLGILLYMPIFGHLDRITMRLWDEARLAVNAIEMMRNHRWITTFYDGKPDLWNTKPPLMIWLQVASIQLFGINEVACRLPSNTPSSDFPH